MVEWGILVHWYPMGTVTRTEGFYSYACECSSSSCRQKVRLRPAEYERMARRGAVVDRECAIGRVVLESSGAVRVVRTSNGGR
jgi:hypothetical protein